VGIDPHGGLAATDVRTQSSLSTQRPRRTPRRGDRRRAAARGPKKTANANRPFAIRFVFAVFSGPRYGRLRRPGGRRQIGVNPASVA